MRYFAPVRIRQSAASIAGVTVWAMRNTGTRLLWVNDIKLSASFDGTAAASMGDYRLCRFSGATPTGGVAIVPIPNSTLTLDTPLVGDVRFADTGLTVSGITFESAILSVCPGRRMGVVSVEPKSAIVLLPGEGLAIRLGVAAVIGDELSGYMGWEGYPPPGAPTLRV